MTREQLIHGNTRLLISLLVAETASTHCLPVSPVKLICESKVSTTKSQVSKLKRRGHPWPA